MQINSVFSVAVHDLQTVFSALLTLLCSYVAPTFDRAVVSFLAALSDDCSWWFGCWNWLSVGEVFSLLLLLLLLFWLYLLWWSGGARNKCHFIIAVFLFGYWFTPQISSALISGTHFISVLSIFYSTFLASPAFLHFFVNPFIVSSFFFFSSLPYIGIHILTVIPANLICSHVAHIC